jgi:hypothetical protein
MHVQQIKIMASYVAELQVTTLFESGGVAKLTDAFLIHS